ncbi:hypothetical protein HS088_TW05G00595 [Tripterygium wilfordii]|uniref:DUF7811 domain-containing protein n=1 Tax=Tripterygium wilfordii TaxID=458696 RepID=A0A7J7DNC5_TRIWF|nr:uncharacterized protein LOC119999126 [Tripterygium wilfordii]KAF5747865.1 hypothetical protein HS088_TW05G00595 [Tripterygium wilfordii]
MAETSVLSFSTFSTIPSVFRSGESYFSPSTSFSRFPISRSPHPRLLRFTVKSSDSGSFFGEDSPGFFPWSDGDDDIQWVQEERVTLFTADGLIQIGGSMVPRRFISAKKQGITKNSKKTQRFQESDYMDPKQELCLGALFDIAATNGLDLGRKLCIFGFCRSIEMLSDVVEDTVLDNGGEVVVAEKASKGGLHERLTMTVAVPYLWGVPPVSETLHLAVRSGGGIVEKVYWQWDFL